MIEDTYQSHPPAFELDQPQMDDDHFRSTVIGRLFRWPIVATLHPLIQAPSSEEEPEDFAKNADQRRREFEKLCPVGNRRFRPDQGQSLYALQVDWTPAKKSPILLKMGHVALPLLQAKGLIFEEFTFLKVKLGLGHNSCLTVKLSNNAPFEILSIKGTLENVSLAEFIPESKNSEIGQIVVASATLEYRPVQRFEVHGKMQNYQKILKDLPLKQFDSHKLSFSYALNQQQIHLLDQFFMDTHIKRAAEILNLPALGPDYSDQELEALHKDLNILDESDTEKLGPLPSNIELMVLGRMNGESHKIGGDYDFRTQHVKFSNPNQEILLEDHFPDYANHPMGEVPLKNLGLQEKGPELNSAGDLTTISK